MDGWMLHYTYSVTWSRADDPATHASLSLFHVIRKLQQSAQHPQTFQRGHPTKSLLAYYYLLLFTYQFKGFGF